MSEPGESEDVLSIYSHAAHSTPDASEIDADPCIVCAGARVKPTFRIDGIESPIAVCTTCGLGRFFPMLDQQQIRSFYPDHYYGGEGAKFRPIVERVVRAVAARHIAFLSQGLSPSARILDVGCGRGVVFGPLADRGFQVYGVEMSEAAARGCDPRAQVRIGDHLSAAGFEPAFFDQIVIWHVLEHLPDPAGTIRECHRILKPGGRLIIAVPNFSSAQARWSGPAWFHLDPPRHLYHFPCDALHRLAEQAGFDVLSTHHFSLRQNPFGWIQSALNRTGRQPPAGLYTLLHRLGQRGALPFSAGDRLAMWAFLLLTTPIAIALSVIASWLRTGATIHISAIRRTGSV